MQRSVAKRLDRRIRVSESQLPNPYPKSRLYFEVETDADVDPLTIRDAVTETLEARGAGGFHGLEIAVTVVPYSDGPSLPTRVARPHPR